MSSPRPAVPAVADQADPRSPGQARLALTLATVGFALNFWAWALLSPLGPVFVSQGIATDAALLVAIPVLVGSLGRILVGALTDRFGGRTMFPILSIATIVPVLFLGVLGQHSYPMILLGGFFLGVAGTTFAIGVPYVNSWFPTAKRGMATGIYGVGMGGTAISAFATVPLWRNVGPVAPFVIVAIVLAVYAVVAWRLMPTSPTWTPVTKNLVAQLGSVMRIPLTWQTAYLYAVSFGGYVAFSVFLPTMLTTWYGLELSDAAFRMAGFVVVAVIMRPVGGTLTDRLGAVRTLLLAYALVSLAAVVLAFHPALMPLGTIAFIVMAMGLGLGSGAVFGLIGQTADPAQVGSITGFVGAAGGLGGFVPPLVMSAVHGATGSYSAGVVLLLIAALAAIAVTVVVGRRAR